MNVQNENWHLEMYQLGMTLDLIHLRQNRLMNQMFYLLLKQIQDYVTPIVNRLYCRHDHLTYSKCDRGRML